MFQYLKTPSGQKLMLYLAGSTTIGLFLGNYVPHTFGLEKYKNLYESYGNGNPMPLSTKLTERLNEALNILEIKDRERLLIKPFSVSGFDLFSAGSTKTKYGAVIGIPFNYEFDNIHDVETADISYSDEKINWDTENGKLLQKALVLSEDEQIFGFCKTLLQFQTHYVLMNSIYPSVSFLMVYTIGHYFNHSLQLLYRPFSMRLLMYIILGLFGVGAWSFMKDFNQVSYDIYIDKMLASMDPKYVKAGVGFYDKQLKRNMALRKIRDDHSFTSTGNINYFLRQKSLPLTIRKSFFEEKLDLSLK